jgi:Uma2 family endonuclease
MATVILDPQPIEIEQLIERRRALGLDRHDEVWEGVYHMSPEGTHEHGQIIARLIIWLGACAGDLRLTAAVNIGAPSDYRVPDLALFKAPVAPQTVWHQTAELVVEVISPGDESRAKLPFYATHRVAEVVLVALASKRVEWLALAGDRYEPAGFSALLGVSASELARALAWR